MSLKRGALLDQVQELESLLISELNGLSEEMMPGGVRFTAQLLTETKGLDNPAQVRSIDSLVEANECRVKVCCVALPLESPNDQDRGLGGGEGEKEEGGLSGISLDEGGDGLLSLGSAAAEATSLEGWEASVTAAAQVKVSVESLVLELEVDELGDLAAGLRDRHAGLEKVLGYAATRGACHQAFAAIVEGEEAEGGSETIDSSQLEDFMKSCDVEIDSKKIENLVSADSEATGGVLDKAAFERFIRRFLRREFLAALEPFATNQELLSRLRGNTRKNRKSRGQGGGDDRDDEADEEEEESLEERAAREAREARAARLRQRLRQTAVVTNLLGALKTDLSHGLGEVSLIADSIDGPRQPNPLTAGNPTPDNHPGPATPAEKAAGVEAGRATRRRRRKQKSDRAIYAALLEKAAKAVKDLEAQREATAAVARERDHLEGFLIKMIQQRHAGKQAAFAAAARDSAANRAREAEEGGAGGVKALDL
mmetsp:Transcript_41207/g.92793  ORF Transcript_41207/g.92793 Transcript_41207/m.92793 type:complete len:483 (-) Transcript_41207:172-1620(-)